MSEDDCVKKFPFIDGASFSTLFHPNKLSETIYNVISCDFPHKNVICAVGITILIIGIGRRMTKRFPTATHIPPEYYKNHRRISGKIVCANDSDNIRFYHKSPLLSIIFPFKTVSKSDWKDQTINVRLAGIDAPELAHFGSETQPFAIEAKNWLQKFTAGRRATLTLHRLDQYSRAVATVTVYRFGLIPTNVSYEMVKSGFATIYEGAGAEYGGAESKLRNAEKKAKFWKKGMWIQSNKNYKSPAQHKREIKKN